MRRDLTWSDGRPITAHDVVFSFKVIPCPIQVPISSSPSAAPTRAPLGKHASQRLHLQCLHKEPLATDVWNMRFTR